MFKFIVSFRANRRIGWLDGIYMGEIFYADYTKQLQPANTTAWGNYLSILSLPCADLDLALSQLISRRNLI
jgi:hypothetical protein